MMSSRCVLASPAVLQLGGLHVHVPHAVMLMLQGWRWVAVHRSALYRPEPAGGDLDSARQVRAVYNW